MKEVKKEKAKKIVIILGILVSMFLFTTLVGYVVEIRFLGDSTYSYIDYLLYLLGYGSLDNVNVWFRLFFSIGSLVVLTLFSSACTVTWLESRSSLKLADHIVISKNDEGEFIAKLKLSSPKRDIYGAQVSLIVNVNGMSFCETTDIAYIPKKQSTDAIFQIPLNSVIYKYFNEDYRNNPTLSDLITTVKYSDMLSGTEFNVFEKYSSKNSCDFVFEKTEDDKRNDENSLKNEFFGFVSQTKFDVDFSNAEILDSKISDRTSYAKVGCFNVNFASGADYVDGDFQMLYVPVPEVTAWGVYHDMKCSLNIKLAITENAIANVQIKRNDGSILNCGNSKLEKNNPTMKINLTDYKRSTWENIKELCFTVFYRDVKTLDKSAEISVEECAFVLPELK